MFYILRYFLVPLSFIIYMVLPAQENRFFLKPVLGLTACQVHGDSYDGYNKLGFSAGVMANAFFSEKKSADIGIVFIQKGARHNQNPEKNDYTFYNLNLNYVEVPFYFIYAPNKFYISLGASVGYLFSYNESNHIGNITGYSPFRRMEYSLNSGLGMNITKKISTEIRANNSFITIRPYGVGANVFYNNFIARWFNKGHYNNILEILFFYKINPNSKNAHSN